MHKIHARRFLPIILVALPVVFALAACSPMLAGQVAGAGYQAAKESLGGALGSSGQSSDAVAMPARQKKLQSVLNSVEVGQEVAPILERMEETPVQKSGNTHNFVCYEYAAVYSATESAVIVVNNGRVVFYGKSHCAVEMQDSNFKGDGKYAQTALTGSATAQ